KICNKGCSNSFILLPFNRNTTLCLASLPPAASCMLATTVSKICGIPVHKLHRKDHGPSGSLAKPRGPELRASQFTQPFVVSHHRAAAMINLFACQNGPSAQPQPDGPQLPASALKPPNSAAADLPPSTQTALNRATRHQLHWRDKKTGRCSWQREANNEVACSAGLLLARQLRMRLDGFITADQARSAVSCPWDGDCFI
ncbi:hypothetical protein CCMA1212_008602, partial [Trichoderma ghanense]